MPLTDEELVIKYLTGDENSLALLIQKNLNSVFSFINRLVNDPKAAEDLTQETFIKVWKNLKKFNQEKKLKPWLFMIARNTTIDYLRRKKEIVFSDLNRTDNDGENFDFDPADCSVSALEGLVHQELVDRLRRGLENLPINDRVLLLVYQTENLTFREIAEMMGLPLETLKTRYFRALIKLKNEMVK